MFNGGENRRGHYFSVKLAVLGETVQFNFCLLDDCFLWVANMGFSK